MPVGLGAGSEKTSADANQRAVKHQQISQPLKPPITQDTGMTASVPTVRPITIRQTPVISIVQPPKQQDEKESPTSKHHSDSSEDEEQSEEDDQLPPPSKIFEDAPISPSEDVKTYGDLIRKVALALGFPIVEPHDRVDDDIFEVLNRDVSAPISLPLSSVLLQSITTSIFICLLLHT